MSSIPQSGQKIQILGRLYRVHSVNDSLAAGTSITLLSIDEPEDAKPVKDELAAEFGPAIDALNEIIQDLLGDLAK